MQFCSSIRSVGMAVLLAAGFAIGFSAEAVAQAKDKAAKGPLPPAGEQVQQQPQQAVAIPSPWTKICNRDPEVNKEICLTAQDLRAETGQFLASVAVRELEDEPKKQFIIAVPPGMQLQPGMRVVIDKHEPMPARYSICFPNACYGDMDIDAKFVEMMKKGQALTIQAINQVGRTVNFTLVLNDFTKAYEGPPIDPKEMEDQRARLQEELQRKAEEARQRLLEQQK